LACGFVISLVLVIYGVFAMSCALDLPRSVRLQPFAAAAVTYPCPLRVKTIFHHRATVDSLLLDLSDMEGLPGNRVLAFYQPNSRPDRFSAGGEGC
jgi:hypothetical protein